MQSPNLETADRIFLFLLFEAGSSISDVKICFVLLQEISAVHVYWLVEKTGQSTVVTSVASISARAFLTIKAVHIFPDPQAPPSFLPQHQNRYLTMVFPRDQRI